MSAKWYYEKGGVRRGPVGSEDIRRMVADGTLLPTDLLWKEGMKDWVPAGKSSNLFPQGTAQTSPNNHVPPPPPPPPRTATPPLPDAHPKRGAISDLLGTAVARKEAMRAIGENLKTAGTLVQKQTYRTKLRQVDLPRALTALGEKVYSLPVRPPEFASNYARIDALKQQCITQASELAERPEKDGIGEKAKQLMAGVNVLARRKVAESQISAEFTQIGEGVHAQARFLPGCEQHVTAVEDIQKVLEQLETEIQSLSKASSMAGWITPYRLLAVGAGASVLALAWFALSGSRASTTLQAETARSQASESTPSASDAEARLTNTKPEVVKEHYKTGEVLVETPKVNGRVHGTRREYYRSGKLRSETVFEDNVALHTKVFRPDGSVYLDVDFRTSSSPESLFAKTMKGVNLSAGPSGEAITVEDISGNGSFADGVAWERTGKRRTYDYDPDFFGFHGTTEWNLLKGRRPSDQLWDNDLMNNAGFWQYEGSGKQHFVGATPHGQLELWYPDGSPLLSMWYLAGTAHGPATVYYPATADGRGANASGRKGQKKAEILFVGGQGSGSRRMWYANGTLASQSEIVRGRRQGLSRDWYDDGQLKTKEVFKDDKRNGAFEWWWPSGVPKAKGTYVDDALHGRHTVWNSKGKVIEEGEYVKGKPKPSKTFDSLVSGKRREGFEMLDAALPRGGSMLNVCGCSIGYRTSGEEDEVLAVIEIKPVAQEAFGGAQSGADTTMVNTYLVAMACKAMFVAVLGDAASRIYGERLTYLTVPGGQRVFKDTHNGRTTFTGLLVVGDQTCMFEIPAETRRTMNNELAYLRCGGDATTLGLPSSPEMKYGIWSAARKVFTAGRTD